MIELVRDTLAFIDQEYGTVKPKAPPPPPPPPPTDDAKKLLGKILPGIAWKETPGVKRSAGVAIVYANESAEERALLERLAQSLEREGKAVSLYRAPATIPSCDLLLVTRTARERIELPDCPQLVIEDVGLYIKQPAARRELWEAILRHVG